MAHTAIPPHLRAFPNGWEAHKDRHCIWIVTPDGYDHSHAFDEVALAMQGAFEALGGSAPIVTDGRAFAGRAPIIYGANLLPADIAQYLPPDSVVINLEQVSDDSAWMNSRYAAVLRDLPVLDYSPRNRDNLAARGVGHAGLLEIGYSPVLTRIRPAPVQDIDVLFYGSTNERRAEILRGLLGAGLTLVNLFNVYGEKRDAAIARAKIVLNLHYYASNIFEIVRISYLLSNRVCVLTEGDATDPAVQPYLGGLAIAPYDRLVERAQTLVADAGERARIAEAGFAAITRRSQAEMLMALIKANDAGG
ncbi:CgeB family protein [Sphingomonas abietis]|uniref:Glycosyltransferase family 1 protein n=1 Tax=Sphingomonas abietis TaxID=3012344 RepID=A0ABY7NRB9_9SPHN|nr:hypothetical protein [Sphingomonas abietis]WBO23510.1 hypothetical protein PBT88_05115 [Sphingomonas abietis]